MQTSAGVKLEVQCDEDTVGQTGEVSRNHSPQGLPSRAPLSLPQLWSQGLKAWPQSKKLGECCGPNLAQRGQDIGEEQLSLTPPI